MTAVQLVTSTWDLEPSVLLGCGTLLGSYLLLCRPLTARALAFAAGIAVLLAALISPIDTLGDAYLFSAHMLQHMLLVLAVPPLLLLGLPPALLAQVLRRPPARRIERVLGQPGVAWLLGTLTLWAWHLPVLYNAALAHEGIHVLQHLSFLVTATIFWWPVLGTDAHAAAPRLAPLAGVFYLLAGMLASSLLGIILTFAPAGLYPAYQHPVDRLGILPLLRDSWGLSVRTDQQIGGLLMWIASMPVYLAAIVGILARWFGTPDRDEDPGATAPDVLPVPASVVLPNGPAHS